jgi:hypothetical protein
MPQRATSTQVPAAATARDALVPAHRAEELDDGTLVAMLTAVRKHEIGIAVGAAGPIVLACGLLYVAGTLGIAVPGLVLAASLALTWAMVPVVLVASRRAFLSECASLGIAKALAARLHWRVLRSELRLEKHRPQRERDRELATRLLSP